MRSSHPRWTVVNLFDFLTRGQGKTVTLKQCTDWIALANLVDPSTFGELLGKGIGIGSV